MKLIGNLKNKVDKAQNKEEAKEIIAQAGMLLDDDELDKVAGGVYVSYEITEDMLGDNNMYTDDNGHTWIGVEKAF